MKDADPEHEVTICEAIGAGMAEVADLPEAQRKAVYLFLTAHSMAQPMAGIVGPLDEAGLDLDGEIMERVRVAYESKWVESGLPILTAEDVRQIASATE